MAKDTDRVLSFIIPSQPDCLCHQGAGVGPPGMGVSAGGALAVHVLGAGGVHCVLQVQGCRVDERGSAQLLDPPQEGERSVKALVPEVGGSIVHGRIEGAEQGLWCGQRGAPRNPI